MDNAETHEPISLQTDESTPQKPFRLWPGVVAVVLLGLGGFVVPFVVPEALLYGLLGALFCALAIVVWWVFFSRALWVERVGAIVLMVVAVVAPKRVVHQSIANGMMGMMLPVYAIPILSLALVAWAVASRRLSSGARRASMVAAILLACGVFTVVRTGGITGDANSDFHWRWTQTPEERLVAPAGDEPGALPPAPPPAAAAAETGARWPGSRGPHPDGIIS